MLIMAEQQGSSTLYVLPRVSPENNIWNVIKMPKYDLMSTTTKNTLKEHTIEMLWLWPVKWRYSFITYKSQYILLWQSPLSKPAWKQQVFGATSSWVSRWLVANNITLCWVIQSHAKSESVNIQLLKQISRKKEMLCKPVHKISSVLYSILFSKLENTLSISTKFNSKEITQKLLNC